MITNADKGNAVVVLNRVEYEKKIESMLSDETVYRHITDKRRNPTSKTELELQNRLLKLKKAGHLSDAEYKKIRPSDSYSATFYGLPKVHKVTLIEQSDHYTIDGSPTYELSKYLTRILKCLYDEEYTVKNSKDFVDFVSTKKVLPNEQIVSLDVVSLFTSIPVDFALKIVREELNNTDDWMAQTNLTVDQICNLLAFVLNNSFFVFKGAHYHQIFGRAMGSPALAELVMQRVERTALRSSPVSVKSWKSYVDDSNACLKQDDVETFHNHLNSINKYIQFTIEKPTVNADSQTIAFMYIYIYIYIYIKRNKVKVLHL